MDESSEPAAPLAVRTALFPREHRGDWERHPRSHLLYPASGVVTLRTELGLWVIPTVRAAWIPAGHPHALDAPGGAEMHRVFCRKLAAMMPDRCTVIAVSPLLREIIRAMARMPPDQLGASPGEHVDGLLLGQMVPQAPPPLLLPELAAPRLAPLARALRADPADGRSLEDWARELGTSSRSLARDFARHARMSFTEYRRQVRLSAAVGKLARGEAVTTVALDLGFASASAFIAMFRRATGLTPRAYFAGAA